MRPVEWTTGGEAAAAAPAASEGGGGACAHDADTSTVPCVSRSPEGRRGAPEITGPPGIAPWARTPPSPADGCGSCDWGCGAPGIEELAAAAGWWPGASRPWPAPPPEERGAKRRCCRAGGSAGSWKRECTHPAPCLFSNAPGRALARTRRTQSGPRPAGRQQTAAGSARRRPRPPRQSAGPQSRPRAQARGRLRGASGRAARTTGATRRRRPSRRWTWGAGTRAAPC